MMALRMHMVFLHLVIFVVFSIPFEACAYRTQHDRGELFQVQVFSSSSSLKYPESSSTAALAQGSRKQRIFSASLANNASHEGSQRLLEKATNILSDDFRAGKLLAHMKHYGNPSDYVTSFSADLDRWSRQNEVDLGLSYSLLHPKLLEQRLFGSIGWLLDSSKCSFMFGAWGDLLTGFGKAKSEDVAESIYELILATLLHRYNSGDGQLYIASEFRQGVFVLAQDSGRIRESQYSRLRDRAAGFLEEDAEFDFMRIVSDKAVWVDKQDWTGLSEKLVEQQTSLKSKEHDYSEIMAECPLEAVRGFIYPDHQGHITISDVMPSLPASEVFFERLPDADYLPVVQYAENGTEFRLGKLAKCTSIDLTVTHLTIRPS